MSYGPKVLRTPIINYEFGGFCPDCGLSHKKKDRFQLLKRLLPTTVSEILDHYPCIYPRAMEKEGWKRENRMLYRDLHELKAIRVGKYNGIWKLPGVKP